MSLGSSVFLVVVGAVLRYALTWQMTGLDLQMLGLILMIAGIVTSVICVLRTFNPTAARIAPPRPRALIWTPAYRSGPTDPAPRSGDGRYSLGPPSHPLYAGVGPDGYPPGPEQQAGANRGYLPWDNALGRPSYEMINADPGYEAGRYLASSPGEPVDDDTYPAGDYPPAGRGDPQDDPTTPAAGLA